VVLAVGRNDPCSCGSGKKYKKCCGLLPPLAAGPASAARIEPPDIGTLGALLKSRRYAELEAAARALLAREGQSGIVWKFLGMSLWMQNKDAMGALMRAAELLPHDSEAHTNLGNLQRARGELEQAVNSHRRALAASPTFAPAHNNLGSALQDLGRLDEAAESYRRSLDLDQGFATAYLNLVKTLRALGRFAEAVDCAKRFASIQPHRADAYAALGDAFRDLGLLDDAARSYRRALEIKPDLAEVHCNLGAILMVQERTDEAEACVQKALEMNAALPETLLLLAQIHAERGLFEQAEEVLKRALALDPDIPEAWAVRVRWRKMTQEDAGWLAQAQRVLQQRLPSRREAHLRYAVGKYFDDVRDYDQAFFNYRRANELSKQSGAKYDRDAVTRRVDRIIQSYDADWFRGVEVASDSDRPAFIVGMWRSGSTLTEQMLASHPGVFGAGELRFWNTASADPQNGLFDAVDSRGRLPVLAQEYLRLLAQSSGEEARVIDKMSSNFWHLGLIHAALPRARIIHTQRNPIDTCLSIYFQNFQSDHDYANDLDDLAHHYREYLRLMDHWRRTLPAGTMFELPYEELVRDRESWGRKLCDFIGLPWDARCLEFHRTSRTIRTASKWQVRQPMGSSSIERWRNYAAHIGPLLELAAGPTAREPAI
jgi:tetratricopeptide (TPR) repeat protein